MPLSRHVGTYRQNAWLSTHSLVTGATPYAGLPDHGDNLAMPHPMDASIGLMPDVPDPHLVLTMRTDERVSPGALG